MIDDLRSGCEGWVARHNCQKKLLIKVTNKEQKIDLGPA